MAWIILVAAGVAEVGWASLLPETRGFTRAAPTVAFLLLLSASMYGLAVASRDLPLGTAYAVWVGIGAVGTVAVGIAIRGDHASPAHLLSLVALVAAIGAVKLTAAP